MFFGSHQPISVADFGPSIITLLWGMRGCSLEHPPPLGCNNICGSLETVLLLFLRDPVTILINIIQKFQDVMMGFSPYGGHARSHYHHYRLLLVADI
jgi:hypothetical protein